MYKSMKTMYDNNLEYQVLTVVSLVQMLNAASIHLTSALPSITSTSAKPSTLLLPPGFDSQLPPRQPMLYPFVVPTTTPTTPSMVIKKSLGPFVTPGWVPISSSANIRNKYKESYNPTPSVAKIPSTPSTPSQSHPVPVLEDRSSKYILHTNDNGPVFESIVYGTWKPDPPLQPVEILNATTTQYNININDNNSARSQTISTTTISDSSTRRDSFSRNGDHASTIDIDGKVPNKTINRQHGGFIDNKQQQQKILTFENQSSLRNSHDLVAFAIRPIESTMADKGSKDKRHMFVKKQGRQKIRQNSTAATKTTRTTQEMTTTPIHITPKPSTTLRDAVNLVTVNPVEVARQINDSIEIKYNHKQSSKHSIELTAHEQYKNHRLDHFHDEELNNHDDDNDDDAEEEEEEKEEEIDIVTAPTTSADEEQQGLVIDDDELDDEGGSSVIRMNWPTDFMSAPLPKSSSKEVEVFNSKVHTTVSSGLESVSAELPLALSSLNIPQSLWPRFPGNITKLGSPYTAESSLEEPALCVPITVRERNMMNSHEIVNIERVFCFPMPSTKMPRGFSKIPSSTTEKTGNGRRRSTTSPALKPNIHNFKDFYEPNIRNTANIFKSQLILVCFVLDFYYKLIF